MRRFFSVGLVLLFVLAVALPVAANGITIRVDGDVLAGADPIQEGGRVLVPLRKLSEALGFTVDYVAETQQITVTGKAGSIVLTVGSNSALVNGEERTLDVPVMVRDGVSYLPVRFVSENLGAQVLWDDATQTVSVTTFSIQDLFEKAMAASSPGLVVDQKMSGTINVEMIMSMQGMEITMAVPATMMVHTYKGDMLTKLTMTMPGIFGNEKMEMMSAVKDGVMYSMVPFSGLWIEEGEVDANGLPDFSALGIPGLESMLDLQQDILKSVQVTDGGRHTVGGVQTVKLNVVVDPTDINEMFATLFDSLGFGADEFEMNVQEITIVLYVDPKTHFTHRTEMTIVAVMNLDSDGVSGSVKMKLEATLDIDPVSEAIEWPEMEIMEMPQWFFPELDFGDYDFEEFEGLEELENVGVDAETDAEADEADDADAEEAASGA